MESNHRALYKRRTPPWKESLRERCCQRLKTSRQLLFNRCRSLSYPEEESENALSSIVGEVIAQELDQIQRPGGFPSLGNNIFNLEEELAEEDISLAIEEIQLELLTEEQKALKEYFANALLEERQLLLEVESMENNEVVCPICQRYPLRQEGNVISCSCGVKIHTEANSLPLVHLRDSLHEGLDMHTSGNRCQNTPSFITTVMGGATNLLITCQNCDFMFIVI